MVREFEWREVPGHEVDFTEKNEFTVVMKNPLRAHLVPRRTMTQIINVHSVLLSELAARAAGGETVGCRSACGAFNTDAFCCRGAYGSPDTCRPSSYSEFFKAQCPQAYSYAYDDRSSTFTCASGGNYQILFCP
ncbi:unnamed protein product [Urochloa humidicola]